MSTRSMVEALEGRWHLSASAMMAQGAVLVMGTSGADEIRVSLNAETSAKLDVTVNGQLLGSFNAGGVRNGVQVMAGRGDDTVFVDATYGPVTAFVVAYGGDGHDMLSGGVNNDLLFGGDGDDTLIGGDGNDLLYGDNGNDVLAGGFGDDVLFGGADDDALYGEMGFDTLWGGHGSDGLDGGDDDDYLSGGHGTDVILGSPGADTFSGRDDASEIVDLMPEDVHVG